MYDENFISKCLRGEALAFDIDNYVSTWHKKKVGVPLVDYLGMTKNEYNAWMLDDSVINYIILAHKENRNFEELIESDQLKIAARNGDGKQVKELLMWLQENA